MTSPGLEGSGEPLSSGTPMECHLGVTCRGPAAIQPYALVLRLDATGPKCHIRYLFYLTSLFLYSLVFEKDKHKVSSTGLINDFILV